MGKPATWLTGPVLGVQFLAFLLGSAGDGLYLSDTTVWRENTFVHAIAGIGAPGWVLVALFAALGAFAAASGGGGPRSPPRLPRTSLDPR